MKNHLAPINRIPPDIFSLIPKYWGDSDTDEILITMTHVCRGWRELLIARTWLWTRLDCTSVDKTRVYIERAKSSHVEISLFKSRSKSYVKEALLLAVPHIRRFKFLAVTGTPDVFQNLTKLLNIPAPSLEELTIELNFNPIPVLDHALFNGDLSSLRRLHLEGIITDLPWKNLRNLTNLKLVCAPDSPIAVTQFLDFFENAPRLTKVTLFHSIPASSDAPPGRMVTLPHLKWLNISARPTHSAFLNHTHIPFGASLILDFDFNGDKSPLRDCLPTTAKNLRNLSRITKVNFCFDGRKRLVQLSGPSGALDISGHWTGEAEATPSFSLDRRIVRFLGYFTLSRTEKTMVIGYEPPAPAKIDESSLYYTLNRMSNLRTLTLVRCNNLHFILALDPAQNPLGRVLCPKLEELVLYVEARKLFNITELMNMARERALKKAKLPSITIIGLGELAPGKEAFKLREHVTRVEYRVEEEPPMWHAIPTDRLGGHFTRDSPF